MEVKNQSTKPPLQQGKIAVDVPVYGRLFDLHALTRSTARAVVSRQDPALLSQSSKEEPKCGL